MYNKQTPMEQLVIFSVLLLFPGFRNELVKMGLEVIQEAKETQHASVTWPGGNSSSPPGTKPLSRRVSNTQTWGSNCRGIKAGETQPLDMFPRPWQLPSRCSRQETEAILVLLPCFVHRKTEHQNYQHQKSAEAPIHWNPHKSKVWVGAVHPALCQGTRQTKGYSDTVPSHKCLREVR